MEELAQLYFAAYPPGLAGATLQEAQADIAATLGDAYGAFWPEASPVVCCDGTFAMAVLSVRRGRWDNAPDCPFIIEVITALEHRRRGLARTALLAAMTVMHAAGEQRVALTVRDENTPAVALYRSLGFVEVEGA